ncbi:MAG: glycolate oxidase subunit GlcF [Alphaproteobacteria bacterium]|nr:glycolate oxidase subunit GlcF [Alphaproteobacteria bacterium]
MQTNFTLAQLADPNVAESERILRKCVHCGFCTATCPTYVLLGDELDSPRGRIYLIKEMFEHGRAATKTIVTHIDRCLSCLACMTTCPSSVHYMHLVDNARRHIEETFVRPFLDRMLRLLIATVMPSPTRFRLALVAALIARPFRRLLPARLGAMLALAPRALPSRSAAGGTGIYPAIGQRRARVALLSSCVQPVLAPAIDEATIRVLTRLGCEVEVARGSGCCGALTHHIGRESDARASAIANIAVWSESISGGGLDAIISNASGCGTMVKDYGHLFRNDPVWRDKAAQISSLTRDVSEFIAERKLLDGTSPLAGLFTVAYHDACSLQHGQRVIEQPRRLLTRLGFAIAAIDEGHLCCGSAGSYNLLQPELAQALRDRKARHIVATGAAIVATGNIGCMVQLRGALDRPVVHTIELIDWATGGPRPAAVDTVAGLENGASLA